MPISSIAKPGAATGTVSVAHATTTEAATRIARNEVPDPSAREAGDQGHRHRGCQRGRHHQEDRHVGEAGVPSLAYFTEVRKLNSPASAKEAATK